MRRLVLIPLAALVIAAGCGGDDDTGAGGQPESAANRDCTGKTLPPGAGATTMPGASATTTAPDASTDAPSPGTTATAPDTASSNPSGWMPQDLAPRTPDTTAGDTSGSDPASTAPPTTYAPKPEIELPDPIPKQLKTTDLKQGTGAEARQGDTVVVHYVGVLSKNGTEFDSNYDSKNGFPVTIGQSNVIQGWHQGLVGMQVGGVRQLDIPGELAYGDSPPPNTPIEAGDALTFVVTLDSLFREPNVDDIEASLCAKELKVEDTRQGNGEQAEAGDTVSVHLKVLRGDNKVVITDTWASGQAEPLTLSKQSTLPGLVDGITGMKVGGQRVITMPPDQAFGWDGAPSQGIPADTDVIAVIDLVGIGPGE